MTGDTPSDGAMTPGQRFMRIETRLDTHERMLAQIRGALALVVIEIPVILAAIEFLNRGRT